MIERLRQDLSQVDTWPKYRTQLKRFRELYGPPFDKLHSFGQKTLGIKDTPEKTTFTRLVEAVDKPPKWDYVSILVKICVRHAQAEKEGLEDVGAHLNEVLALWGDAFENLGGERAEPHIAKSPEPQAAEQPAPGRQAKGADWVRRQSKKWTIPAALVLTLGIAAGAYAFVNAEQGTGQHAGAPSGPGRSAGASSTTSSSPTATGTGSTGDTGSMAPTADQPYVDAKIAWSNDDDQSTNPQESSAIVKVYPSYKIGYAGEPSGKYHRTDVIRVKCQITNGRPHSVGQYYTGPRPLRSRIWYLMDTHDWVPAVYVDTGRQSLPACSPADADTDS